MPDTQQTQAQNSPILSGTIKRLREGYGFILGLNNQDYFIHWTSMAKESPKDFRQLEVGDRVEFSWTTAPKGLRALDVMVLD